jgi:hypothetical protein
MPHPHRRQHSKILREGLRSDDLKDMFSHRFTIDQYKSKMGLDDDIMVLAFKIKEKHPAIDAMEFCEKSFSYILDADVSTGEEEDGTYCLFVELERSPKVIDQIEGILKGFEKLCGCDSWRFKYFKDVDSHQFSKEAIKDFVPLTPNDYKEKIKENKMTEVSEFLGQGVAEVADINESNMITMKKPYTGSLELRLHDIGDYDKVVARLPGAVQLDETSNGEVLFLEKYLGVNGIHKVNDFFIIPRNDQVLIVSKGN